MVQSFECTTVGPGSTIWNGTAFDCPMSSNEISLRHTQFHNRMTKADCNNGNISVASVRVENDCYTSQLNVTISSRIDNNTIVCSHENNGNITNVGTKTLTLTTGKWIHNTMNDINLCVDYFGLHYYC